MGMKAIVGFVFASGVVLLVTGCTGSYTVREGGVGVYPDPVVLEPYASGLPDLADFLTPESLTPR